MAEEWAVRVGNTSGNWTFPFPNEEGARQHAKHHAGLCEPGGWAEVLTRTIPDWVVVERQAARAGGHEREGGA